MEVKQLRNDPLAILKADLPTAVPSATGEANTRNRHDLHQSSRILPDGIMTWK